MNTLLIASSIWTMAHSNDLVFNGSFEITSPPCSADYRWSARFGKCIECSPGFYGSDCSESCRYPNYGDGCQQKCQCAERMCHATKGCKEPDIAMDMEKMAPVYTSNVLLGCMVFLLAILVLLKTSRYIPKCKNCLYQNEKGRLSTQRYDSLTFESILATTTQHDAQQTACNGSSVDGTI